MVFHQRQVARTTGKRGASYPITRYGGFKRQARVPIRGRGPNARTGGYAGLELKFKDYFLGDEPLTADWVDAKGDPIAEMCLNALTQGTGEDNRIGRAVNAKGIFIRGSLRLLPSDDITTMNNQRNTVRLILCIDTQTNLAQAVGSEVMDDLHADSSNSFKNLVNNKRFKIIGDKTVNLFYPSAATGESAATFSLAGMTKHFTFMKRLNHTMTYSETSDTPTVAECVDNSIHLFVVSDALGKIHMSYQARFRFTG